MTLGHCTACNVADALVTFDGDGLCADCFDGTAQEQLSSPDVDDGAIAFVAMSCARLIAAYDRRDHIVRIGAPGIALATWERFATALAFQGRSIERDDVEGFAEVFDQEAINAAAGYFVERMHSGALMDEVAS